MPQMDAKSRMQRDRGTHCGWKWRRWRNLWLKGNPLCVDCGRLAQCVHHVVPRHAAPERMYDPTNVASLCNQCHEARHATR
jgi:5-methylcytosine-specific restriction endonuclease McrA